MRPRAPQAQGAERGVALLMVILAIAILTAVAVEFSYNSRVDLELATNQRDELQAHYLAESGIGMSRLLLKFQKQVDAIQMPNIAGLMQQFMGGGSAPGGAAGATPGGTGAAAPPASLNIQLWRIAHVDCHMLQGLIPANAGGTALGNVSLQAKGRTAAASRSVSSSGRSYDEEFPELAAKQSRMSFGTFQGCFSTKIEDEEQKLNVNQLDSVLLTEQATGLKLMAMLADKRFDFVFDTEDANHVKVPPQEVLINLRDWVDQDQTGATLNLTGTGNFFLKGSSDENGNYSRYTPSYHAKSSHFDSLDELYMVHGVNDRFMAAFRDRLTVYPDLNTGLNINSDDPVMLYMSILAVGDPQRPDPRLKDPLFVDGIIQRIRQARVMSFFGMSTSDFVTIVQAAGIAVNSSITTSTTQPNRFVTDKSSTFKIRSTGEAGHVRRTIEAVVRLDDGLGRLVHWKEE